MSFKQLRMAQELNASYSLKVHDVLESRKVFGCRLQ